MNTKESTEERNTRVVCHVWELAYNSGDISVFRANVTDDFIWKGDGLLPYPGQVHGKEAAIEMLLEVAQVFPEAHGKILKVVAGGDAVVLLAEVSGQGIDGLMGLPKIPKPYKMTQCVLFEMTPDGKISEQVSIYDRGRILSQLGVIPQLSSTGIDALGSRQRTIFDSHSSEFAWRVQHPTEYLASYIHGPFSVLHQSLNELERFLLRLFFPQNQHKSYPEGGNIV